MNIYDTVFFINAFFSHHSISLVIIFNIGELSHAPREL